MTRTHKWMDSPLSLMHDNIYMIIQRHQTKRDTTNQITHRLWVPRMPERHTLQYVWLCESGSAAWDEATWFLQAHTSSVSMSGILLLPSRSSPTVPGWVREGNALYSLLGSSFETLHRIYVNTTFLCFKTRIWVFWRLESIVKRMDSNDTVE